MSHKFQGFCLKHFKAHFLHCRRLPTPLPCREPLPEAVQRAQAGGAHRFSSILPSLARRLLEHRGASPVLAHARATQVTSRSQKPSSVHEPTARTASPQSFQILPGACLGTAAPARSWRMTAGFICSRRRPAHVRPWCVPRAHRLSSTLFQSSPALAWALHCGR